MRSTKRAIVIVLCTAGLLLTLPGAALADGPTREVTPFMFDALVTSCGFPVRVHAEGAQQALDFGDRLGFTTPKAKATLTNVDSGESIVVAIPGPELLTFHGDGTVTFRGPGPWLWLREHPITAQPGMWLTYGLIIRRGENHVVISAEQHGRSLNLCAELG